MSARNGNRHEGGFAQLKKNNFVRFIVDYCRVTLCADGCSEQSEGRRELRPEITAVHPRVLIYAEGGTRASAC